MACQSFSIYPIGGECLPSRGGIKRAWIAQFKPSAFNMTTTSGESVTINEAVTGVSSGVTDWSEFVFQNESGSITETYTIDKANGASFVTSVINLVFTRMELNKRKSISALVLTDALMVVEDSNGVLHAFGTEEPVYVSASAGESGTAKTDGNRYTLELTDTTSAYAPIFTDEAAATFIAARDAD